MNRGFARYGLSAGLSTILGAAVGALINLATSAWSWSAGIGVVAFVGAWAGLEIWRNARQGVSAVRPVDALGAGARTSSLAPPWGLLPPQVHGRDVLVSRLQAVITVPDGHIHVICGLGGAGKTTVALKVAQARRPEGVRAWWINARDRDSVASDLIDLALQLGAGRQEITQALTGMRSITDLVWQHLEALPERFLLVIDNADDPDVLVPEGGHVEDGNGILRGSTRGVVLVTSRVCNPTTWGGAATLHTLRSLNADEGAQVLLDLAGPHAGGKEAAVDLAARLGGLPLALQTAGRYLASDAARLEGRGTFVGYRRALDVQFAGLLDASTGRNDSRAAITATWELSLDLLARRGFTHARRVMRLVGAFAAAPLPAEAIDWQLAWGASFHSMRGLGFRRYDEAAHSRTLSALSELTLLDLIPAGDAPGTICVSAHPLVVETNALRVRGTRQRKRLWTTAIAMLTRAADSRETDEVDSARWLSLLSPHVVLFLERVHERSNLSTKTIRTLIDAANRTGRALYWSGQYLGSLRLARLAVSASRRHLGEEHPTTLASQHALGSAFLILGRPTDAVRMLSDTLSARQRVLGRDHNDTLRTQHNVAQALASSGRYDEAEQHFQAVLRRRMVLLGPAHRVTVRTRANRAHALADSGRFNQAVEEYLQIQAISAEVLGHDDPETQDVRQGLANTLTRLGRHDEAEPVYRALVDLRKATFGPDHPETLASRQGLGNTLLGQRRYEEAETEFRATAKARERVLGAGHPDTVASRAGLTRVWEEQERERRDGPQTERADLSSPYTDGALSLSLGDMLLRRRQADQAS